MKRLVLGLAAGVVTLLPAVAIPFASDAVAAPALTVAPDVVGWWSVARPDSAVPSVPPPDAGPEDLYVAGSNALPALPAGLPSIGPVGPVAVAALQFELPEGSVAGPLRLRVSGVQPPVLTLSVCRALSSFSAEYGGPWSDAPAYDCSQSGTARLGSDGEVVLDGIDGLRRGRELTVVLVPGPLDRIVLAAPDARTLAVSAPAVSAARPVGEVPPPAAATPDTTPASAGTGSPAFPGGPLRGELMPAAVPSAAPTTAVAPLVAVVPVTKAEAALPGRPWPTLAGTLVLSALVFLSLVRPRRGVPTHGDPTERGVGRFRSEREGRVPDLT